MSPKRTWRARQRRLLLSTLESLSEVCELPLGEHWYGATIGCSDDDNTPVTIVPRSVSARYRAQAQCAMPDAKFPAQPCIVRQRGINIARGVLYTTTADATSTASRPSASSSAICA